MFGIYHVNINQIHILCLGYPVYREATTYVLFSLHKNGRRFSFCERGHTSRPVHNNIMVCTYISSHVVCTYTSSRPCGMYTPLAMWYVLIYL